MSEPVEVTIFDRPYWTGDRAAMAERLGLTEADVVELERDIADDARYEAMRDD